jgi:endonuclease/exonuclease/phosphatase family metal-dependent hydrolase
VVAFPIRFLLTEEVSMLKKLAILITLIITMDSYAYDRIKVLTYNIGALGLKPFDSKTDARVAQICQRLEAKKHDLVFIQEAWSVKHRKMLKNCGYPHIVDMDEMRAIDRRIANGEVSSAKVRALAYLMKMLSQPNGYDSGMMILSRHPLKNSKRMIFSVNGSEDFPLDGEIGAAKGVVAATLEHPTMGDIFVATTHLVATYRDHSYDDQRIQQIEEMVKWIDENNENLPTIVGGDFNMAPSRINGFPFYLATAKVWNSVRHTVMAEYLQPKLPYSSLTTFPGTITNIISDMSEFLTRDEGVIDHIFGLNGAIPVDGYVTFQNPCSIVTPKKTENFPCSDHYAMSTLFSIQN